MDLKALKLEPLDLDGVRTLIAWAEDEAWNPGPYDAEVFYATDKQGYFGYYVDNQLIAGGAVISYNMDFGFMGLFIVHPEHRSKGIGRKLWYQRRDLLLSRLKPHAPIGMDGVSAMQPFYMQGGFKKAFNSLRFRCIGQHFPDNARVIPIQVDDFDGILAYDSQCFGFPRKQFLFPWLQIPGNFAFKYVEMGELKGFVNMRKVKHGFKICPLFADNPMVGEALLAACLTHAEGAEVFMDVPEINPSAISLIKQYAVGEVFECARMYHGNPPEIPHAKIFGLTSFELG